LAVVAAGAAHSSAHSQSDILIGWLTAAPTTANPNPSPPTLTWSTSPSLPLAAIEDLTELRDAIAASALTRKAVKTSDDGRTVALAQAKSGPDLASPTGVTVWVDWRVADSTLSFADASQLEFLSNNHAVLAHRPAGGPYTSYVIDLRRPTIKHQFTGYQLATLRVTDTGKWAALTADGILATGQLGEGDEAIAGTPAPLAGPIRNLMWRKDGRFLIIEREDDTLTSYLPSDWSAVAVTRGSMGPSKGVVSPAGRDSFIGSQTGQAECTFTVNATGQITSSQWMHQAGGEVGVFVSPTRRFITTQARKPGDFIAYFCRRTPDAVAADMVPEFTSPPRGSRIQACGWLHWQP
jgi:hypothetical protein